MSGDSQLQRHDAGSDDLYRPSAEDGAMTPAGDATEARDHAAPVDEGDQTAVEPLAVAPTPPITGDEAVDEAMTRLAQAQAGSFGERIEAGEHAHRSLQSRLGGLGGA